MSDVDVDATLSGDSGYDADFYALGFVLLDGDSSLTPPGPDAAYALDSALANDSSFGSDFVQALVISATLGGDSGHTPTGPDASYVLDSILANDSSFGSDFVLSIVADATLGGDSTFASQFWEEEAEAATLAASSSLDITGLDVVRGLGAILAGDSEVLAWESWRPTPGAPGRMPAMNAAATLQQFIDALGVGKSVTKTPTANSTVVDPHPPRKPFTPR